MKKKIAILGSTGSIGVQALDIIEKYSHLFEVVALSTNQNINLLTTQIQKFQPSYVGIADLQKANEFTSYSIDALRIEKGNEAIAKLAVLPDVDMVLIAVVGIAGLQATMAALEVGKDVALANKETLVVAGQLVMEMAKRSNARIIPVDSEHSAIFQCLANSTGSKEIRKVYLTASGGPFKGYDKDRLGRVTVDQALRHPNWKMGKKISVDSATLMNKGLEVIEAKWLFGLTLDQIVVIIHPQSIIHSMVEFVDGSILAQMSKPDMRLPILYALSWPERFAANVADIDLLEMGGLTFEKPDCEKFPCLTLAFDALRAGGTMTTVLNAANEIAVERFLNREIPFEKIPIIVQNAMSSHTPIQQPSIEEILEVDRYVRRLLKT